MTPPLLAPLLASSHLEPKATVCSRRNESMRPANAAIAAAFEDLSIEPA